METFASREPNTIEVLPQHKFDCRSLDAYLNQHLPGFGTEPEAKLTVAQYRYWPQPSPAETNLYLVLFFLWPWVVFRFPPPCFFFRSDLLCRWELLSLAPALHSEYFQFQRGNGSTIAFTIPAMRRNLC